VEPCGRYLQPGARLHVSVSLSRLRACVVPLMAVVEVVMSKCNAALESGGWCPFRDDCYRFTYRPLNPFGQSWIAAPFDGRKCVAFFPHERERDS